MKVKGNCRALDAACRAHVATAPPLDVSETVERTRGRTEHRRVEVYAAPPALPGGWPPVGRVLRVSRWGDRGGAAYAEVGLYVTSRTDGAASLGQAVRDHWGIENGLHREKDVAMNEDGGGVRSFSGATVLSLLRGQAVSLCRRAGYRSMTEARSWLANRVPAMLALLRT